MQSRFPDSPERPAGSLLSRAAVVAAGVALLALTACDTLSVPGVSSEARTFDEDLPELNPSRLKITTLEGTIDRKAELKMLAMQSRSATAGSGAGEYVPEGGEERALVTVHRTRDGTLARVRVVQGTEKLNYTDTAYFDEGQLFHYKSEFAHATGRSGYSKVVTITDEYQIMAGAITEAYSVTRTKVRERGTTLKDETVRDPAGGGRLGIQAIREAIDRRIAFVEKKITPEAFLAGEGRR